MARTSKKVGTSNSKTTEKKDRVKKAKIAFPVKGLVDAEGESIVDADGKLIGVPVEIKDAEGTITQAGFNPREHKPLAKTAFADEATFFDFKAHLAELSVQKAKEQAASYRKKATTLRNFGDEKIRKKASKLQKMQEQAAKLKAELEAEGVDLDGLLDD